MTGYEFPPPTKKNRKNEIRKLLHICQLIITATITIIGRIHLFSFLVLIYCPNISFGLKPINQYNFYFKSFSIMFVYLEKNSLFRVWKLFSAFTTGNLRQFFFIFQYPNAFEILFTNYFVFPIGVDKFIYHLDHTPSWSFVEE